MKRKYMNTDKTQWKEPELTTLINEMGGGTNMQSKPARVLHYKAQWKNRADPESPLPTFDLNVFARGLCAANTCWC